LEEKKLEQKRIQREQERMQKEQDSMLKERELQLKEREMDLQREKARREMELKESPANKLKLWGDALRNAISHMPVESIDIVSWWFQSLEKLFEQLKVPAELHAVLVRPYLRDKAESLLSRMDLDKSTDYRAIKKYILQEMQLSPSVYLDKFQSVCRDSTETYHHFANIHIHIHSYSFIANCQTAVVHKNKTKGMSKIYKSQYIFRYNILTVKLQSVIREMRSGSCLL